VATKLEIYNSCFIKLGAEVVSATTDSNKRNNLLNAIYDIIKAKQLREHPWNFAMKRAQLVPNPAVPTFKFYSSYDLPSDYLKIKEVRYESDYAIEGALLVSEEGLTTVGSDEAEVGSTTTVINATGHEALANDTILYDGERQVVASVTANTITVSSAFGTAPSAADPFTIYRSAEAYVEYIANVDEALFTADFAECLAWILAAEIAYALVQNRELSNEVLQKAEQMKRLARSMDAQEGTPIELMDNEYINVRL